jgi:hypothetical protein
MDHHQGKLAARGLGDGDVRIAGPNDAFDD